MKRTFPSAASHGSPVVQRDLRERIEAIARQRLMEEHPHSFYFRQVQCVFDAGVLRLHGRVPTYYLKQLLQTRLMDIEGVLSIENDVDVVSSVGLSTARSV